jgi:O-acetyl-ADP-ribose deacetylase (regulator of RNase III)
MPFEILRNDIAAMNVDAIVNSTGSYPHVGGGADFMIHKAAGPDLIAERKTFGFLNTSEAIVTKGYHLKAKHVIHTVGPVYEDGKQHEEEMLRKTYRNVLNLAIEHGIGSIAFPLISSGAFGFPRGMALEIALSEIKSFLDKHDMNIYLVVYDKASYQVSLERFITINDYLKKEKDHRQPMYSRINRHDACGPDDMKQNRSELVRQDFAQLDLELDETFAESLFRLIDERELNDVEVYKKANIDRKLFSKIKSNCHYQPSKITALAFAIALELNLDQTSDLLNKAGYSLSPSSTFDKIIEYFIESENYDLYEINQTLFAFDQKTIGVLD